MKLTYFTAGDPFQLTEFPFDDMYITDAKFIKLAIKDNQWLGILTGDYTNYIEEVSLGTVTSLEGFNAIQTGQQITKAEIINRMFSYDDQMKLMRDKQAGRNLDQFVSFDEFVQSVP